jgi:UDP-glucose 4-epimerase
MSKKIAITGALGHIGSKLIHSLNSNFPFEEIRLIDNLMTQRYSSLFDLPNNIPFTFFEEDIMDANLDLLFNDIDIVIHLAAITDMASSFGNSDEIERVNFKGTNRVIEACIKNKAKLIFPSSTSIYGSNNQSILEDSGQNDINPKSPYAQSKFNSEIALNESVITKDLNFCILRLGTIFGPSIGMRFHTAVNKFCWQANFNKPITIWETALDQKRPYLGINDAVSAIKFIISNDLFDNHTFNIVSKNFSVKDVITCLKDSIDSIEVELISTKVMNNFSFGASSEKIEKLGFKFEDNLSTQINETINSLKNSNSKR